MGMVAVAIISLGSWVIERTVHCARCEVQSAEWTNSLGSEEEEEEDDDDNEEKEEEEGSEVRWQLPPAPTALLRLLLQEGQDYASLEECISLATPKHSSTIIFTVLVFLDGKPSLFCVAALQTKEHFLVRAQDKRHTRS